ncbi:MAG: RNA methyltransferase [Chloroflexi bacterium]|nr:RNA methyltransferase [Chloroflexota bacterium]
MSGITSLSNSKVKHVRLLQERRRARQQAQQFVLEGVRLIEESVRANAKLSFVFHTEDCKTASRGEQLLAALDGSGIPCYAVSDEVMRACSDTQANQGILAVAPYIELPYPQLPTITMIVDSVRDPGNLGTMMRTAWAAGVELMLLPPGSVDVTNPKVVRSAMGAHFHVPTATRSWDTIRQLTTGSRIWVAAADGETLYTDVDWTSPSTLIMGGEAMGAGHTARLLASGHVRIPMAAGVESLNTAVAAAVILFEVVRQRGAYRRSGA